MPHNHRSALEVSFRPDNEHNNQSSRSPSVVSAVSGNSRPGSSLGKRKAVENNEDSEGQQEKDRGGIRIGGLNGGATGNMLTASNKRRQLPKSIYYQPPAQQIIQETENLRIADEDIETLNDNEKPVRELYGFVFFDPSSNPKDCLVSLANLEQTDGVDYQVEGAGYILAADPDKNDEDEGQEYNGDNEDQLKAPYVHLGAIFQYSIDYSRIDSPVYVETQYAFYILKSPGAAYQDIWESFYTPVRISQIVVSTVLAQQQAMDFESLVKKCSTQTVFGQKLLEQLIIEHAKDIQLAIPTLPQKKNIGKLMSSKAITHILSFGPSMSASQSKKVQKHLPTLRTAIGNLDTAALHPDNQSQTVVTPRIAGLSDGLFKETLYVIGNKQSQLPAAPDQRTRIWKLLRRSRNRKEVVPLGTKISSGTSPYVFHDSVRVKFHDSDKDNKEVYKVGNVLLFCRDTASHIKRVQDIPSDARIHDYFWFGYLLYLCIEKSNYHLHVQWFNHGSSTLIADLAHPQELFLDFTCGNMLPDSLAGTISVDLFSGQCPPDYVCNAEAYFAKSHHNRNTGSFVTLDFQLLNACATTMDIGSNCHQCSLNEQQSQAKKAVKLFNSPNILNGFSYGGVAFHYHDFVLYHASDGPGHIGFITSFKFGNELNNKSLVTIQKVGRIQSISEDILPAHILKDPQHLYLTQETIDIPIQDFVKVVYVASLQSLTQVHMPLEEWLQHAPDHFYITWKFPKVLISIWNQHSEVHFEDLKVCSICCEQQLEKIKHIKTYSKTEKLATLDLFSGVGAFSKGLASGSSLLDVTHAIELSPSAAETFRINSPSPTNIVVYNQCANEVLKYAAKLESLQDIPVPLQKYDLKSAIPLPPKPGSIDVITAGFPCQGHSTLNMFKKVNDRKNNLVLTTLSYVDYFKPAYVFFENVPGFLKYALGAEQVDQHITKGGIEAGGLKLCVRALLDMNYQVQFGLLQAAHYGTPQRRLRFFLVAAKTGNILPKLPEPTHHFPEQQPISIKLGEDIPLLQPISLAPGTALHDFVNVQDAIGDLFKFDWKHPKLFEEQRRAAERPEVLGVDCDQKKSNSFCGPSDQYQYQSQPQTRYQKLAQGSGNIPDLQHYTKTFSAKLVEKVHSIPLKAKANYQSIPAKHGEWQLVDPSSSMGVSGYKPGAYSRIEQSGVFQTTVTNIKPTAKQSQVLHPWCRRILTVRELARSQGFEDSFVFKSLGNNIVDMHRQIGNAVPLQVGQALGRELQEAILETHKLNVENAIVVDDDDDDQ